MGIFDVNSDVLFAASLVPPGQLDTFAQRALSQGLELYLDKKYDQAMVHLKRAVGLSPRSANAVNAYEYLARSYQALGDTDSAIKTYQQSIRADPSQAQTHVSLGNIYTSNDRYEEARAEYETAVRLDPSSSNRFSLGQGYLATGQYDEATSQFARVRQMEPRKPYGDYGLGQVLAKQGRYDEAIQSFERAISVQADYWEAYSEMGYAYADSGDMEKAQEMVDLLTPKAAGLADTLSGYIYEKSTPKMEAVFASDLYLKFPATLTAGTNVADLASYLSDPGAERVFSMVFSFSKQMDATSVENELNWSITRPTGTGLGDGYNYGFALPTTEVLLAETPMAVYYDPDLRTATVLFKVRQNDSADGTIDPAHLTFSFTGTDVLGLEMDTKADQYAGYSGFA